MRLLILAGGLLTLPNLAAADPAQEARSATGACLAAVIATATLTPSAPAQDGPPTPKLSTAPSPLVGYGVVALLAGIIIAISLYASKRQHTDV